MSSDAAEGPPARDAATAPAVAAADSRRRLALYLLAGLTLVALAIRLWVAWGANQQLPDDPSRLVGDEPGYDYLAWSLFEGRFFDWPGRTPVYPLFLAACYLVLGHTYAGVLYVQAVVSAAAVPLTWVLARRFTGPRGSLAAAAVIAFHGPLVMHLTRLYTETLFTVLLLLAALVLLWALDRPRPGRLATAGVVFAIVNLCRPTLTLFPLVVPFLLPRRLGWGRRLGLAAAFGVAMAATTAPWTYHNYRTYGTFLPLSVSIGALWQGSPEFYHLAEEQGRHLLEIWGEQLNPKKNGGHNPFTIEGDRYFTARAIESISREPGVYLRYCFLKAAYLWIGNPVLDWPHRAIFDPEALNRYYSPVRAAAIFLSRLLPLVALGALVVLGADARRLAPLLALCAYFTVVHAITYPEVRYSEPLHPMLAVLIAAAAVKLGEPFVPGRIRGRGAVAEEVR